MFYAKVLAGTLKEAYEQAVASPDAELISLREELVLMKQVASDSVALYAGACAINNREAMAITGQAMAQALKDVAEMCTKASQVALAGKNHVSVQNIVLVSNQIVKIAHDVFGPDDPRVELFNRLISEKVRLPREDSDGTLITPDQDVIEMDDTVPAQLAQEEQAA